MKLLAKSILIGTAFVFGWLTLMTILAIIFTSWLGIVESQTAALIVYGPIVYPIKPLFNLLIIDPDRFGRVLPGLIAIVMSIAFYSLLASIFLYWKSRKIAAQPLG